MVKNQELYICIGLAILVLSVFYLNKSRESFSCCATHPNPSIQCRADMMNYYRDLYHNVADPNLTTFWHSVHCIDAVDPSKCQPPC